MATYSTKQQKIIMDYIDAHRSAYITVAELSQQLRQSGHAVGVATIYRHLERLEQQGLLHKITGEEGACYQYCDRQEHQDCFLLKCEGCGRILHADCHRLAELYRHLEQDHHFVIHSRKTVFYGLCQDCLSQGKELS